MSLIADALRAAERERAARKAREDGNGPAENEIRVRGAVRPRLLGPLTLAAFTAAATAGFILWLRSRQH